MDASSRQERSNSAPQHGLMGTILRTDPVPSKASDAGQDAVGGRESEAKQAQLDAAAFSSMKILGPNADIFAYRATPLCHGVYLGAFSH